MKDIQVFSGEMRRANLVMAQHRKSRDEHIQKPSELLSKIYLAVSKNNEELLGFMEHTLNNPAEAAAQQGTWLRQLSENMAKNEELWRMLPMAAVMSTYALVDMNRTEDGKLSFLTVTKAELDSLRSDLRRTFADEIKVGAKAGQLPIAFSASLLWDFLSQPYKTADTK